jgi:hypothetical protein
MATLRFLVKSDAADDPEASTSVEWTAAEIRQHLPQFAALFPDGCDAAFPSLTYTTDVSRYVIDPLVTDYLHDQEDERAAAEQTQAAAAAEDLEVPDGDLPF